MLTRRIHPIVESTLKLTSPVSTFSANYAARRGNREPVIRSVDLAYVSYESASDDNLPPLFILHGLFGSKNNWTSMSKAIHKKTGRKVISIDARNHGDSPHSSEHTYRHMVEDVANLMEILCIPEASILGHSMGGRTAMLLALLKPELVTNLIVADISPIRTSPNIYSMITIFDAMNCVSIPDGTPMSQARKIANEQLIPSIPDVGIRNFIITNLVQSDKQNYVWRVNIPALQNNFEYNIASFPDGYSKQQYNGNTLFIAGGKSDYVGRDELPQIRKSFPAANLTFIDGAGHWVHSEKPEPFLKLVCDFLIRF